MAAVLTKGKDYIDIIFDRISRFMILISTMDFSYMPDIMGLQETILDIVLWVKSKMASISARLSYKLTSFSTEWT